jgi:hypothetical protein
MGLRVLCGGDTNGVGQSELLGLSLDQQAIDDDYLPSWFSICTPRQLSICISAALVLPIVVYMCSSADRQLSIWQRGLRLGGIMQLQVSERAEPLVIPASMG